jgi:hypothetical protein
MVIVGAQPELAVPLGAGPGLKPFACLRFFRTPEQLADKGSKAFPQALKRTDATGLYVGAEAPTPS